MNTMQTLRRVNEDDFIFKVNESCHVIEYILKLIAFPFVESIKQWGCLGLHIMDSMGATAGMSTGT